MRSGYYLLTKDSKMIIAFWNGDEWLCFGNSEPFDYEIFDGYNKQEITAVSSYGNMTAIKQLYG